MKDVIIIIICTMIGFTGGVLFERSQKQPEIITSEIHLVIPKDDIGLKKQYLHALCQKTMLEELIKWNEKSKILKKEKKDGN